MFGLKPLLGLEPMAPIRPQLLVSHANHSATETSICMYVCMYVLMYDYIYVLFVCRVWLYDDIRGDQKPRGPPLTCLTLWANLALASMYVCMTTSMYWLYVGFDYTYIDVNALAQGIKSFLASLVWSQAVSVCMYVCVSVCVCASGHSRVDTRLV